VSLPAEAIVVLAGQDRPGAAWRTDARWRAGVSGDACARLADLGRGHPLALALLAYVTGMTARARARRRGRLCHAPDRAVGSTMDKEDPGVRAALRHANLRPGERAVLRRTFGRPAPSSCGLRRPPIRARWPPRRARWAGRRSGIGAAS
jgi:hypothetical protein